MQVEGVEVSQEAIDKATVWACTQLHFTYGELQQKLLSSRVHPEIVYGATNRLIKAWRLNGKIIFRKSQWHWQGA